MPHDQNNPLEALRREREARTILGFLGDHMDVVDERDRRGRSLKERLGFKGIISCCGAGFRPTAISVRDEEGEDEDAQAEVIIDTGHNPDPGCLNPFQAPVTPGMNLAAALTAERQFRASPNDTERTTMERTVPATPSRMSLMRLLEETDSGDGGGGPVGNDSLCCVCMGRKKGAAFIPCGHTLCRVCSRELWLNRGTCPLCNRSIIEILDIF